MKYRLLLFFLLFYRFSFSQTGMDAQFKIYDTKTKQVITIDKIIADCANANVLFFGEDHNDSAGHYLEDTIFKTLYKAYGNNLALSMEMFETDEQFVVNEYLEGFITEDRFSKDARAWSNYKDYRHLVEFAKQNNIPVIAANAPRRYVNLVTRKGMKAVEGLPEESKKFLPPLPYDTATGRYYEKFTSLMSSGNGGPASGSPNLFQSQNLWDAGMSYSIYNYWKENKDQKIFHLCGRFHCDEKLGTLAQLQKRKSKLKILNISCFSDASFNNPDWENFSNLGDYIIITNPELKKTF